MSQARAISKPPPKAAPSIAAIVGIGRLPLNRKKKQIYKKVSKDTKTWSASLKKYLRGLGILSYVHIKPRKPDNCMSLANTKLVLNRGKTQVSSCQGTEQMLQRINFDLLGHS